MRCCSSFGGKGNNLFSKYPTTIRCWLAVPLNVASSIKYGDSKKYNRYHLPIVFP